MKLQSGWQTWLDEMSNSLQGHEAPGREGPGCSHVNQARSPGGFPRIEKTSLPDPDLCDCNCLIMRGNIYYTHKESSLLLLASGFVLFFFFSLSLFLFFFCRSREREVELRDPTDISILEDPRRNSFPPHCLRHLRVWASSEWRQHRERPNEFFSNLLPPEPSITAVWSGEPRSRHLCPGGGGGGGGCVCMGWGGGAVARGRAGGGWAREFSHHPTGPFGWAGGAQPDSVDEEVIWD